MKAFTCTESATFEVFPAATCKRFFDIARRALLYYPKAPRIHPVPTPIADGPEGQKVFDITRIRGTLYLIMILSTTPSYDAHARGDEQPIRNLIASMRKPPEAIARPPDVLASIHAEGDARASSTTWKIMGETDHVGESAGPSWKTMAWDNMMLRLLEGLEARNLPDELAVPSLENGYARDFIESNHRQRLPRRITFVGPGEEEVCPCCGQS